MLHVDVIYVSDGVAKDPGTDNGGSKILASGISPPSQIAICMFSRTLSEQLNIPIYTNISMYENYRVYMGAMGPMGP